MSFRQYLLSEAKPKRGDLYETVAVIILKEILEKRKNLKNISLFEIMRIIKNEINPSMSDKKLLQIIDNHKSAVSLVLRKIKPSKKYSVFKEFKQNNAILSILLDKIKTIGLNSHNFSTADFYIFSEDFIRFLHSDDFNKINTKKELFIICNTFWMSKDFLPISWKQGGKEKIEVLFQPIQQNIPSFKTIFKKETSNPTLSNLKYSGRWITVELSNGWKIENKFHCVNGPHKNFDNTLSFTLPNSGGMASGSLNTNKDLGTLVSEIIKKYNIKLYTHSKTVQKRFKGMELVPDKVNKKLFDEIKNATIYLKNMTSNKIIKDPSGKCGYQANPLFMTYSEYYEIFDDKSLIQFALKNALIMMGWLRVFTNQEFIERFVKISDPLSPPFDKKIQRSVATYEVTAK